MDRRKQLVRHELGAEEGRLERYFPAKHIRVPKDIRVEGDFLCWDTKSQERRNVEPSRGILEDFLKLADPGADAMRVLTYAKKWGVLELCRHSVPYVHSWLADVWTFPKRHCRPLGREPIEVWLLRARQAQGLLNVARQLHRDQLGGWEDWSRVYGKVQNPELLKTTLTKPPDALRTQKAEVERTVNDEWLAVGNVRPCLDWREGTIQLEFGSPWRGSLVGVLAIQLTLAIAGKDDLVMCSHCHKSYIPSRKPRAKERHFCETCRAMHIPEVLAQMDYMRRQREKKGDHPV